MTITEQIKEITTLSRETLEIAYRNALILILSHSNEIKRLNEYIYTIETKCIENG